MRPVGNDGCRPLLKRWYQSTNCTVSHPTAQSSWRIKLHVTSGQLLYMKCDFLTAANVNINSVAHDAKLCCLIEELWNYGETFQYASTELYSVTMHKTLAFSYSIYKIKKKKKLKACLLTFFILDVTFCILYFSSNSCSTCFGQPCAHHQELTTAWCYSLVLVCAVAAWRLSRPVSR